GNYAGVIHARVGYVERDLSRLNPQKIRAVISREIVPRAGDPLEGTAERAAIDPRLNRHLGGRVQARGVGDLDKTRAAEAKGRRSRRPEPAQRASLEHGLAARLDITANPHARAAADDDRA